MTDRPPKPEPVEFDPSGVPEYLQKSGHWLVWAYEWPDGRDEWSKVPKDGAGGGYRIDATDPENGVGFETALETYRNEDYDGLGLILDESDLLVAIDWDDCRAVDRPHGSVPDIVKEWIERLDSFTELSPSVSGYHTFALGRKPEGDNRDNLDCEPVVGDDPPHVEIYDGTGGRYMTVTGHVVDDVTTAVEQRPAVIDELHDELIADDEPDEPDSPDTVDQSDVPDVSLEDQDLIEKAKASDDGGKFERLWRGDTSGYSGDHSAADQALCNKLAFWTGKDRQQMDRLFRQSGLMRPKWDEVHSSDGATYGEMTIQQAITATSETYDPSGFEPATDGGATAQSSGSVPDSVPVLHPTRFKAHAGINEDEGGSISDLNDREKAARLWELIQQSDRVHVRVKRDTGELWGYDDETGTWNPDGERVLQHAAGMALPSENIGGNLIEELKVQVRTKPGTEVNPDEFGLQPGKLAVKNGLVDFEKAACGDEDALRPLEPEDYALSRAKGPYDPNADSTEWTEFVDDVVEDGMIAAVQEYIGYCLHRDGGGFERALLLVGSGANGKSTFLQTIEALLGEENATSISPYDLGDKPSLAQMHGTFANISADLAGGSLQGKNLENFKKLTGGDRVQAKRLYKDPFRFRYDGGMVFAANEVPNVPVSDDDTAFWRRWIIVQFDNYFPEGSEKRDEGLRDRLTTDENLAAVLNWAIEGWRRLMQRGEFTNAPTSPDETRRKWQKWGDSVDEFLSNVAVRDDSAEKITTGEAYEVYRVWCRENDKDAVGRQRFTQAAKSAETDLGYTDSIRTARSTTVDRGYKAFGTVDDMPDPIDLVLADQESDDDGGRNTSLEDHSTDDTDEFDQLKPKVAKFVRQHDDGEGCDVGRIYDEFIEDRGVPPDDVDRALDRLREDGRITEPESGVFRAA